MDALGHLLGGMGAYAKTGALLFGYWLSTGWAFSFLFELPFKRRLWRFLTGFLPAAGVGSLLLGLAASRGPCFRVIHFSWWLDVGIILLVALSFLVGRKSKVAAALGVVCVLALTGWFYVKGLSRIYSNLARETRVAEITLDRFEQDGKFMVVRFVRIRDDDKRLPPEVFRIEGDEVYVEAAVVKFKQENALLGGRSIYVFRRMFGNLQAPARGAPLDRTGQIPKGGKLQPGPPGVLEKLTFPILERMEKEVWKEFLWLSQNEFRSDKVDAAFNTAVGKHLELDRVYQISIQHNGAMLFRTVGTRVPPVTAASNRGGEDV